MPVAAASGIACIYRIRAELLNALIYHLHGNGARPGHILFREEKAKTAPAVAPAGQAGVKPAPATDKPKH